VSGQQHALAALYPRERPGTHFTGGSVGPRAGLDGRKILSPPGFDPGPSSSNNCRSLSSYVVLLPFILIFNVSLPDVFIYTVHYNTVHNSTLQYSTAHYSTVQYKVSVRHNSFVTYNVILGRHVSTPSEYYYSSTTTATLLLYLVETCRPKITLYITKLLNLTDMLYCICITFYLFG